MLLECCIWYFTRLLKKMLENNKVEIWTSLNVVIVNCYCLAFSLKVTSRCSGASIMSQRLSSLCQVLVSSRCALPFRCCIHHRGLWICGEGLSTMVFSQCIREGQQGYAKELQVHSLWSLPLLSFIGIYSIQLPDYVNAVELSKQFSF